MSIVAKALWFVESNFKRCPPLEDVAEAAGTTRFHLSRTFRLTTGMPVMGYMRGRRLTEAYKALSAGAPSILSVALEAGYGSHEAFTRAFRDHFGYAPERVRDGQTADKTLLVEPIRMTDMKDLNLKEPRQERCDAMTVAGVGADLQMSDVQRIPALWQELEGYLGTLGETPGEWYGVCSSRNASDDDGFLYIAGVRVPSTDSLPSTLRTYRFPAQNYLVFRHEGHISEIRRTMQAIFGHYLPENGYDTSKTTNFFELYDESFNPMTGRGGLEIWIPAVRAG